MPQYYSNVTDLAFRANYFGQLIRACTSYEAYGDSFSVGFGVTPAQSWVGKLAEEYNKTLVNRAVSGSTVWNAIKAHNQFINPGHNTYVTVMTGLNDSRSIALNLITRTQIKNAYKAILANHFLKFFLPGSSTDARLTKTGTWQNWIANVYGLKCANGSFSTSSNASFQFSFYGNNVVLSTGTIRTTLATWSVFDITIDGVSKGLFSGQDELDGVNGENAGAKVIVFTGLSDGFHTMTVTNTNGQTLTLDYVGVMKDPQNCPPITLCEIPKLPAAGYAGYAPYNFSSDASIDAYNTDITSIYNEFSSIGYPVQLVKTNIYYNISTGVQADNIHPNLAGYHQIYNAVNETIKGTRLLAGG